MEMLLTVEQAATRLQLHPETVRRQLKRGEMRGVKRGRVWRVPESALQEAVPATDQDATTQQQAEAIWAQMISQEPGSHNAALQRLFAAPDEVRAIVMARSGEAAAEYYATPEGEAELADWRALSDPVHDEGGDYYSEEEEAQFRAQRAAQGAGR